MNSNGKIRMRCYGYRYGYERAYDVLIKIFVEMISKKKRLVRFNGDDPQVLAHTHTNTHTHIHTHTLDT